MVSERYFLPRVYMRFWMARCDSRGGTSLSSVARWSERASVAATGVWRRASPDRRRTVQLRLRHHLSVFGRSEILQANVSKRTPRR